MKISFSFYDSKFIMLFKWLFFDNKNDQFKNFKLLKLASKFSNVRLSIIFIGLSFCCLWYESLFTHLGVGWVEAYNLGAIFLLLAFIFCNKQNLKSTKAVIYLLLFVVALLISGLWASIIGLEMGMIVFGIMVLGQFILAFVTVSTYKNKTLLINIVLALSLPLILVGIFQGLWGGETSKLWVSSAESLVDARAFGFFGSPNILGSLSMITAIAALAALLDKKKWYYFVYELLAIAVLILTYSRSAWIGLAAGLAVALLVKNWKLIFITPICLLALLIPSVKQRLFVSMSREYLVDAALDGRIWSVNNAVEILKTSPILGTGPGSYGGQTAVYYNSPVYLSGMQNGYVALPYTDNQWLEILVQTGIFGTVFIGGFFISHFVNNLRQYTKSKSYLSLGVIAAIVAVFVNGLFGNIWEFGAIAVLSGAYLGLGNVYEK